jgi:hypothetical protein
MLCHYAECLVLFIIILNAIALSVVPLNVVTPSIVAPPGLRYNIYLPYLLQHHPCSQGKYNIVSVTCGFAIDNAANCASVNAALEVQYITAVAGSSSKA